MADEEQLKILKKGVGAWNKWRIENTKVAIDLSEADLSKMPLQDVNFAQANLSRANLSEVNLRRASLFRVNLSHSNLKFANLSSVDFSAADLSMSDLSAADLSFALLYHTNLQGVNLTWAALNATNLTSAFIAKVDFTKATFSETILSDVNLSTAKGLETCQHWGPSVIDFRTLMMSESIPEIFLKGCGLPDEFIAQLPSYRSQPIQFYSCFISHSSKDQLFCDRLYNDLQGNSVRCWYFPEDATWGKSVWGEIDQSIKVYDKLVVVCSKSALTSGPVLREIERALNREDKENKEVLFPIRIDDYIFKEWQHPRKDDVLAKVVGDFSAWNSDAEGYAKSLKRLLKSLKAEQPPKAS